MNLLLAFLLALSVPTVCFGGDWRVTPIRIDLGRDVKSGSVTVYNGPGAKMQAQLSAGEWSQTRPLEVRIDSRVAAAGVTVADLQEQFDLSLKVRDAVADARALGAKLAEARRTAQPGSGNARALQALAGQFDTAGNGAPHVLFNALPHARTDLVMLPGPGRPGHVVDAQGKEVPSQLIEDFATGEPRVTVAVSPRL